MNWKASNILLLIIILSISCHDENTISERSEKQDIRKLNELSLEESLIPIRPGMPGKQPFWNKYSKRFIHAPSFDFPLIENASTYSFIASASDSNTYRFESEFPWDNLSPIWLNLPVGFVDLEVVGKDRKGTRLRRAGRRRFYKAASFAGPYNTNKLDFDSSSYLALSYLFNQKHIQNWAIEGTPDTMAYKLYCYPAKIIGAVIEGMLLYAQMNINDKYDALKIAKGAADYLISISEPPGTALEYFPPTYKGEAATAGKYRNQFMMIYPAELAQRYLNLYNFTKESKYFKAALRIADTYSSLQLVSGTWKLKLWKNGTSVNENLCIPVVIIEFLHRLKSEYKISKYNDVYNKALDWIFNNPVETFDWSGQFEDINPSVAYKNLTKHDACAFAIFLFQNYQDNPEYVKLAKELLRFAEDQFVVWEKPMPHIYERTQKWITPCVLEQYDYYVPIDASAAKLMETYLAAYETTKVQLYFVKAIELANSMTIAQLESTGRYPTYWEWNDRRTHNEGWLNCAVSDIKSMIKMNKYFIEEN